MKDALIGYFTAMDLTYCQDEMYGFQLIRKTFVDVRDYNITVSKIFRFGNKFYELYYNYDVGESIVNFEEKDKKVVLKQVKEIEVLKTEYVKI